MPDAVAHPRTALEWLWPPRFMREETEAEQGLSARPRSCKRKVAEPGLEPGYVSPNHCLWEQRQRVGTGRPTLSSPHTACTCARWAAGWAWGVSVYRVVCVCVVCGTAVYVCVI